MRIALICFPRRADAQNAEPWPGRNRACDELENTQALALARHMRDGGRLAPLLICRSGSSLARCAAGEDLPRMEFGGRRNLLDMFRLWRWQKKHADLGILVIGQEGLGLGCKLLAMRKEGTGRLAAAFFLRPPAETCLRELVRASQCLCGSSFVLERLEATLQKAQANTAMPELVYCAPGMELEDFNFSAPEYLPESGAHFVFGMAESLLPGSGALLVARAMGAIWQRNDLPPWEVRMFGAGPRFGEVLSEARTLGVASRLGILSDQPMARVSGLCHAWLAPGSSPEELPHALWTGFAAGLPVICTQSPLHRERLMDVRHNSALRVAENNPQEMARAMIGIMRDRRLRQHMARAGRDIVRDIGLQAMAQRVCALLERWERPEESQRLDPDG